MTSIAERLTGLNAAGVNVGFISVDGKTKLLLSSGPFAASYGFGDVTDAELVTIIDGLIFALLESKGQEDYVGIDEIAGGESNGGA